MAEVRTNPLARGAGIPLADGFQIGDWTVHPETDSLVSGDLEARVTPRTMDVLVYLAGHAPNVISAGELLGALWSASGATDNAVYKTIAELRRALRDDPRRPRYIHTVAKRGYRLIAPVLGDPGREVAAPSGKRRAAPVVQQAPEFSHRLATESTLTEADLLVAVASEVRRTDRSAAVGNEGCDQNDVTAPGDYAVEAVVEREGPVIRITATLTRILQHDDVHHGG